MRGVVCAHPFAFAAVAAGIAGSPSLAAVGAVAYLGLFSTTCVAVFATPIGGGQHARARAARVLLRVAAAVPVFTLVPATAWAFGVPLLSLEAMVRYHGVVNALGHVGLGVLALALLAPQPRVAALQVPFSRLQARSRLAATFLDDKLGPAHPLGLTDDLDAYARAGFDPRTLHPTVRDFYLRTLAFDLEVTGRWHGAFWLGGLLWAQGVARALGQLGLPGPAEVHADAKLTSTIVDVDDAVDGRSRVRGWVRTWVRTGRTLYVAAYAEHARDGVRYMNIAFPLPGANLTSVLDLSALPGGGLRLTSQHRARPQGDQGVYLVRNGRGFRLPIDETIDVVSTPAATGDSGDTLSAVHTMWIFGLTFLTLNYRVKRRL